MQRFIWAVLLSFAVAMVLGPVFIPWLKKLKFGQTIYDLGPQSHKVKQGTPTMGGIIFAVPMIVAPMILSVPEQRFSFLPMALLSTVGFGLVGFVDDESHPIAFCVVLENKYSTPVSAEQILTTMLNALYS